MMEGENTEENTDTNEEETNQTIPSSQQASTTTTTNKRKKTLASRAPVWNHFSAFFEKGLKKGKCNYCGKVYCCDSSKNGTSSINTHLTKCLQNPAHAHLRQSQLSLQPQLDANNECIGGSLTSWKFDYDLCRKKLASMIIKDELPFKLVEGEGFIEFLASLQPKFKIPSRWTISRDCFQLFLDEKKKLHEYFKLSGQTVCITTDSWTSLQQLNYMCVTAHFIDKEWNLHKKIINFCTIESHRGEDLGKQLDACLREWGIAKVFAVTVDNASSNDTSINFLKGKLVSRGSAFAKGKYLHMRCVAHILNLVVKDGLKDLNLSINRVRDAVKFIRHSPARLRRFKDCCATESIECQKMLCLDVATRWNSTYLMLSVALKFEKAFERFETEDPYFRFDLENGPPTGSDWENIKRMTSLLSTFYSLTLKISGSLYVTSNDCYQEISTLSILLNQWIASLDSNVSSMGVKMKAKFDKYWGDPKKMNKLLYVGVALDPRFKFDFIEYALIEEHGQPLGSELAKGVKDVINELFEDYKAAVQNPQSDVRSQEQVVEPSKSIESSDSDSLIKVVSMGDKFHKRRKDNGLMNKSELEVYLENNDVIKEEKTFNILEWWKVNQPRLPILSCLARDVLSMPVSTVASESAFSTGKRVLDPFRSSLTPKIVESLICTQDWMRKSRQFKSIEEDLESIQKYEDGITNIGANEVMENMMEI